MTTKERNTMATKTTDEAELDLDALNPEDDDLEGLADLDDWGTDDEPDEFDDDPDADIRELLGGFAGKDDYYYGDSDLDY